MQTLKVTNSKLTPSVQKLSKEQLQQIKGGGRRSRSGRSSYYSW